MLPKQIPALWLRELVPISRATLHREAKQHGTVHGIPVVKRRKQYWVRAEDVMREFGLDEQEMREFVERQWRARRRSAEQENESDAPSPAS